MLPMNLVVISYEFTYRPFSGNGILARSLVQALVQSHRVGRVSVLCARPAAADSTDDDDDRHVRHDKLKKVYATTIPTAQGWKRLDDQAAWSDFGIAALPEADQAALATDVAQADAILAIDWTGACGWRTIVEYCRHRLAATATDARISTPTDTSTSSSSSSSLLRLPPLVYLNFRVFSSGVADATKHAWYDDMERQALTAARTVVCLSEADKMSLQDILRSTSPIATATTDTGNDATTDTTTNTNTMTTDFHVLVPPLRQDMIDLAHMSPSDLSPHLPPAVAQACSSTNYSSYDRFLITCVTRLSPEKDVERFVQFVQATPHLWHPVGPYRPLLAGAASDPVYAQRIRTALSTTTPPNSAIVLDTFLGPAALAAVWTRTALNIHPCSYEAYGMTIVEAAAFGVPTVLHNNHKGNHSIGASVIVGRGASFEVDFDSHSNVTSPLVATATPSSSSSSSSTPRSPRLSAAVVEHIVTTCCWPTDTTAAVRSTVGALARTRALAWDEPAYGDAMLDLVVVAAAAHGKTTL